jgi:IS5 family transposase
LSEEARRELNTVVLQEFANRGLSIGEGIAVDARLVKSASRPVSKEGLMELKEKRESAEGEVDKNGNALKISRDAESDWTVTNAMPHYGLKEHASVDVKTVLVLATTMTPASVHDSTHLPYLMLASYHPEEPIRKVYADKRYHGEPNRSFLYLNEVEDGIIRTDTRVAKITKVEVKRNNKISKQRYIVEQFFGLSHLYQRAYRARFTMMMKNIWDAMCRQMAFNLLHGSRLIMGT